MTTKPTRPMPWPRVANEKRVEAIELGEEIVRLADDGVKNIADSQALKVALANIARNGERIQRLMIEARQQGEMN